ELRSDRLGVGWLWARVVEKAIKLGLLYAASEAGPAVKVVGAEAGRWGSELATYCTRLILFGAQNEISDNPFDAKVQRVLKIIREAGASGAAKTDLLRACRGIRAPELNEILTRLVNERRVVLRRANLLDLGKKGPR